MKRFFFSMLCAWSFLAVQAQSYDYLTFKTNEGEQSVKAVGTVITFSDDMMKVKGSDAEFSIALANLQKFFFTETPADIEAVAGSEDEEVKVFTVSGQYLGSFASFRDVEAWLPKGIYVAKAGGETKKMMVK